MAAEQLTLHRQLWRLFSRLPRLVRVWIVVVLIAAPIELLVRTRSGEEQRVRAAVATAVRDATGADPASGCSALSSAGLSQFLTEFGGADRAGGSAEEQLAACRALVPRLRAQATSRQVADFARGSVRAVQFHADGSALVIYLAADHRLGAELTMRRYGGRWLIDGVAGGEIAGAQ
jgi:hypothetical protein